MSYYTNILNERYKGKVVTADLKELDHKNIEFDYSERHLKDKPTLIREGTMNLDYREYLSDDDAREETDDDEYDERENWNISTGVSVFIDENNVITYVEIRACVSCTPDSGLGDCVPEEEWTSYDLQLACKFLDSITS